MFLIAIIDWFSRYILAWELSNTQDSQFCLDALEVALSQGQPEIFNSDQGSQFTSQSFTQRLQQAEVQISMDGRGRCLDNIFIERFWRSVKYENIYVNEYESVRELQRGLRAYFEFYNTRQSKVLQCVKTNPFAKKEHRYILILTTKKGQTDAVLHIPYLSIAS